MNLTDNPIKTKGRSGQRQRTRTIPVAHPEPASRAVDRSRSQQTSLAFQVILAIAACMALIGVVAETGSGTSPDDAPPVVFVQTD